MNKIIFTVASWEDRFGEGFENSIKEWRPTSVVLFYYAGYEYRTEESRLKATELCKKNDVGIAEVKLDFFQPKNNWISIRKTVESLDSSSIEVLIDISTMPRDTIWSLCYFLDNQEFRSINYVYFKAKTYSKSWLSRDSGQPRLLYKMSGISQIGLPTLLVVFPGFDFQRVLNLVNYFEPQRIVAGIHNKDLHLRDKKLVQDYLKTIKSKGQYEEFVFDAFDFEGGFSLLSNCVSKYKDQYNILVSSLGPKTSALIAYKVAQNYPDVGLCYIPCKEYNQDYSHGTSGKVVGKLERSHKKLQLG